MARSLLVAPAAENVGLARTCLGLLHALDRRGVKVAFVKPVAAQDRRQPGPSAARVTAITALCPPEPLTTAELEQQVGEAGWMWCWRRSLPPGSRAAPVRCGGGRGIQGGTLEAVRQFAESGVGPGAGCRRRAGRELGRGLGAGSLAEQVAIAASG